MWFWNWRNIIQFQRISTFHTAEVISNFISLMFIEAETENIKVITLKHFILFCTLNCIQENRERVKDELQIYQILICFLIYMIYISYIVINIKHIIKARLLSISAAWLGNSENNMVMAMNGQTIKQDRVYLVGSTCIVIALIFACEI